MGRKLFAIAVIALLLSVTVACQSTAPEKTALKSARLRERRYSEHLRPRLPGGLHR